MEDAPPNTDLLEQVVGIANRTLTELNQLPPDKRVSSGIVMIMHIAEQIFTLAARPDAAFVLLTTMLTDTYRAGQTSKGKNVQ